MNKNFWFGFLFCFILFASFNSVYSKRGPLSYFEKVATKNDPFQLRIPPYRMPKKSIEIPEFKKCSSLQKSQWDKIANKTEQVMKEISRLENEKFQLMQKYKKQLDKKPWIARVWYYVFHKKFIYEKQKKLNKLWNAYWRLLEEARKRFEKMLGITEKTK